jgi:hypothetical protein
MKTAVEWFQDQIIKIVNGKCELSEIQIFEQAKAMEKEQIIDAFDEAIFLAGEYELTNGEQYYKETFKSEQ